MYFWLEIVKIILNTLFPLAQVCDRRVICQVAKTSNLCQLIVLTS